MADNKTPTIAEEAGLPENWVPIDVAPIIPSRPPQLNPDSSSSSSAPPVGSLPPSYQQNADFVRNAYRGQSTPNLSLMPLGIQGNPSSNAGIQSTAKTIVTAAIAAIPPAAAAASTDVDDGLVHGDAIWESDPAYLLIRDDFNGGTASSGDIGEVGWSTAFINNGTSIPVRGVGGLPGCGAFKINNGSSSDGFQNINLAPSVPTGTSGGDSFIPLFDYPIGWKAVFIFSLGYGDQDSTAPSTAQKSLYIGLASGFRPNTAAGTWPVRPNIFYGLRYDTSTTAPAISDTTFKFETVANVSNSTTQTTRNNTQGTVVDTTITPTIGVTYRLEIQMIAAGTITMSLNGSAPQSFTISTTVSGGAGSNGSVSLANNVARVRIGPTAAQTEQDIFVAGSKVAIVGTTVPALDGSFTLLTTTNSGPSGKYVVTHANIGNFAAFNMTMTGYPAVVPIFSFGNDNQAAPLANTLSLLCDYCSVVWNPGVGGGTGTPVSTKPRYF
jgi:hypothetical protein